jgi:hypothetical protein
MFQSWLNALTKPNVTTFEAEIPRANWTTTLIGVAVVAVVSAIMALITAGATAAMMNQMRPFFDQQNIPFRPEDYAWAYGGGTTGVIGALFGTFISFFLGAGLLWLLARMLGGTGSDFMTHSYLLSLSYTPTRVIGAVLNIIPGIGWIFALLLSLYQLYLAGLAMQASQRMQPGRAQMAAFLPTIVLIVLIVLCCFVTVVLGVAVLGGLGSQ